jgi:hypothetical protein
MTAVYGERTAATLGERVPAVVECVRRLIINRRRKCHLPTMWRRWLVCRTPVCI